MIRIKRLKIAQYSLGGCEGCTASLLSAIFSDESLYKSLEMVSCRSIGAPEIKPADVAFVEGSVLTEEDAKLLRRIRNSSKMLVALGACSAMGGVNLVRNLYDIRCLEELIYGIRLGVSHLKKAEPIASVVSVDFLIPGCPPPLHEIREFLVSLLIGKEFRLTDKTVCFECSSQGLPCLLEKGEVCFGPITRGGCEAICIRYGIPCWGCRGILEDYGLKRFLRNLQEHGISIEEVQRKLRLFLLRSKLRELIG